MNWKQKIKIKNKIISNNSKSFIIAEIGSNHNQSFKTAKKLILKAKNCGADAVKFQSIKADEMMFVEKKNFAKLKDLKKINLNERWYKELLKFCNKNKIIFFSTPFYYNSIPLLQKLKVPVFKLASTNFGFHSYLNIKTAKTKKPLFISTGLQTISEISKYLENYIYPFNNSIVLMHCVSRYPTNDDEINLSRIGILKKNFNSLVGFSDHSMSTIIPAFAVSLGARVIEKHITLSRKSSGPDHPFALEPKEFKEMVQNIRKFEETAQPKIFSEKFNKEEKKYRKMFVYKCIADKNYKVNDKLKNITKYAKESEVKGIDVRIADKIKKKYIIKNKLKKFEMIKLKDLKLKNV